MVMVWLEGGQGEVRGACAPPLPPPPHPKSPHLDPPPNRPARSPSPPKPLLDPPPQLPSLNPFSNAPPPPPQGASGQHLVGGVVGVQNRGVAPPPPWVWRLAHGRVTRLLLKENPPSTRFLGGGGSEANKKFVYLKPASNFRPLS